MILVSGAIFSGFSQGIVGGINFKLSASGAGPIFLSTPNFSGALPTMNSGGTLSSGGLADGMELSPGQTYFIPKLRLVSGVQSVRVDTPAASSGSRLFWDNQ
jgi:hypothetical protein